MAKTYKTTITPADIINAVKIVPKAAKKEKWFFTFDKEEGTLYYSPKRVDRNAELYQVNDEFAVYLNKKTKAPKGVMVEYYRANFLKHHKEFQPLFKAVFDNEDDEREVSPDKNEAYSLKVFFEKTLVDEATGDGTHHIITASA